MIRISESQAAIIELLHKGKKRSVIARQLGRARSAVYVAVDRLIDLGLVERDDDTFRLTGQPYEVRKTESGARTVPVSPKPRPREDNGPGITVPITSTQEAYLRQHAGTKPRSQMARELGVDKVTLNLMIIQLRQGRVNTP